MQFDADDRRDPLWRVALALGFAGMALGLIPTTVSLLREEGFGVHPALATGPAHLHGLIVAVGGCLPMLLGALWGLCEADMGPLRRLRSRVVAAVGLGAAAGPLLLLVNWLLAAGVVGEQVALLPGLVVAAATVLFALSVYPLSGGVGVGIVARPLLGVSALWAMVTGVAMFAWIAARTLLGTPGALWMLERPIIEVAALGFVGQGGLTAVMFAVPGVSDHRDLVRTILRAYQPVSALLGAWLLLHALAIRFPGGLQHLLLVPVSLGIAFALGMIAHGSGLLRGWQAPGAGDEGTGGLEMIGVRVVMGLLVAGGLLLALTAVAMAATASRPPVETLASEIFALLVGLSCAAGITSAGVIARAGVSRRAQAALALAVGGSVVCMVLWGIAVTGDGLQLALGWLQVATLAGVAGLAVACAR